MDACIEQLEPRNLPSGLAMLTEISEHWQEQGPAWWIAADVTGDGKVSLADITAVGRAWGVNQAPVIVSYTWERWGYQPGYGWQDDGSFLDGPMFLIERGVAELQPDGSWLDEVLYP